MAKYSITFEGDPMGKKVTAHYGKIMEEYAKAWDTDIVFVLCHGDYDRVPRALDFDKFYIFIQLLPEVAEGVESTKITHYMLNGEKVVFPISAETSDCPQGDALRYSKLPEGAEEIVDEEGTVMAVTYDSSLFIANDFIHCRLKEDLISSEKTFNYLIDKVANDTNLLTHLKAGIEVKSKRVLEAALKVQLKQRLDKENIQLKAAQDTLNKYEQSTVDCHRKIITGANIVNVLRNNLADIPSTLEKTWEELYRIEGGPMYTEISFTKSGVKAMTTPITVKFNKKEYYMGNFAVTLGFDGSTEIRVTERIGDSEAYDHPHVSSGKPCWGNFSGEIPKRIGYGEFDVAFVQIYTFLCHYDSGNPYRQIEHWPLYSDFLKEEERKEKIKEEAS